MTQISGKRNCTLKCNILSGIALSLILVNSSFSLPQNSKIVDMSYPFDNNTIYWPTENGFVLEPVFYGMKPAPDNYFYSAFKFCAPEHGGTHIDAPRHFSQNGITVDQIPPEQLIGNAVVVHVDEHAKKNKDYEVTVADIQNFEKKYRPLNEQDIVLFYTGWGKYWPNKNQYLGSNQLGDTKNLHFPGLSKEAAQYLVERKVKGVGLDTASLDPGNAKDFWAHRTLLGANIYGVENLAHLELLPPVGTSLIVAPMKIKGGSGGPTRVFALLPNKQLDISH